jgi:hypothetical protein
MESVKLLQYILKIYTFIHIKNISESERTALMKRLSIFSLCLSVQKLNAWSPSVLVIFEYRFTTFRVTYLSLVPTLFGICCKKSKSSRT